MKYLLDTQVLIWAVENPQKLGARAAEIIRDAANELLVSKVSVWELAIKLALGKLGLKIPLRDFMQAHVFPAGIRVLNVELEHIFRLQTLPLHHRDPFDRILIAQSLVEGFPLISGDASLSAYPIEIIN